MAAYLLDTSFLIAAVFTKRTLGASTLKDLGEHRFTISIITLAELYEGAYHRVNPDVSVETIRQELDEFKILHLTDKICLRFGELRAFMRRHGATRSDFDLLIAATALHHSLTILTHDVSDFEGIPDLRVASL